MRAPSHDARVELRVTPSDLKRWRISAALQGVSLSEWIRRACNATKERRS